MFPPIPQSLDQLHPIAVHLPIGILLAVPALIIVGMIWKKNAQGFAFASLVLMILGTAGIYVAVESGEAAAQLAIGPPAVSAVIHHHEELAEATSLTFTILTLVYAALIVIPLAFRREMPTGLRIGLQAIFLVLYMGGATLLANTGHWGGVLVHEYGIHAIFPADAVTLPANAEAGDDD